MNFLVFIFAFLIFNIVIFAHEIGHFFTAKLFGIKVEEFAMGMGPKILSKKIKDTIYSIRCFPIGGFCALEGEENSSEHSDTCFSSKPLWKKSIVLLAGGFMNLVVGFLFALILSYARGVPSTVITEFNQNANSLRSGLRINDQIISINNKKVFVGRDVLFVLRTDSSEVFDVSVMRNGVKINLKNIRFDFITDINGKNYSNVDFHVGLAEKSFINLINYSVLDIFSVIKVSVYSLWGLVTGKFSLKDMAGPIGMATQIGDITKQSLKVGFIAAILEILSFMSMFSISIGIFNLIPFPALDGGRVAFSVAEKIYGKKFKPGVEAIFHTVGFYLLMALMLAISYNDILRIIKKIGGG